MAKGNLTESATLKKRNRELSILNSIAEELNKEVDLDLALKKSLAQVIKLFELKTGWIWLIHEDSNNSYLAASQNLPPALANDPTKMEGTCFCLDKFASGNLEEAANVNAVICTRLKGLAEGTEGLKYHASIPIYAHGKNIGILNATSKNWSEISNEDLQILHTIGDMLGIAIERNRLFSKSITLGATEERNRLAREIHDTLAQGMVAITLQLETAEEIMNSDANKNISTAKDAIHHALKLARNNLEEARRSVQDLRAAPLEGRSLAQAIKLMIKDKSKETITKIGIKISGQNHPLPPHIESSVYRMIQEGLNNAITHAEADTININLAISSLSIKFTISDDGQGFEAKKVKGRFGLIGLSERVSLLGGHMDLKTEKHFGTKIKINIPLHSKNNE